MVRERLGLGVHVQSLPTGSRTGIRDLAPPPPRFPESEHRIAAALRELERHGYLERSRVRLSGGQVVTRTVFYDRAPVRPRPGYDEGPLPRRRSVGEGALLSNVVPALASHQVRPRNYFVILVTWPAPTVRPPSRMANFRPSSIATGWMRLTVMSVLSPGMTISVPSGRVTTPVTSVVRK